MDGYQFFDVSVLERIRLSPSLLRFVLSGDGLSRIRLPAPDLYLKIFFPTATAGLASLARGTDWYQRYLMGSPALRLPMRTFTVRALESQRQAVVIDFALHGDHGPASRWAQRAEVGDALVLYAPLAARWGRGYTWRLPSEVDRVLLVADECALPAVAGIIESIADTPAAPPLTALLEVPETGDQLSLRAGPGSRLQWYPRQQGVRRRPYGAALLTALAAQMGLRPSAYPGSTIEQDGIAADDAELLWELAVAGAGSSYVWIATESALAARLRRLVIDAGIPRQSISCMGYWRQGRAQC